VVHEWHGEAWGESSNTKSMQKRPPGGPACALPGERHRAARGSRGFAGVVIHPSPISPLGCALRGPLVTAASRSRQRRAPPGGSGSS